MYNSLASWTEWLERSTAGAIKIGLDVIRHWCSFCFRIWAIWFPPQLVRNLSAWLIHNQQVLIQLLLVVASPRFVFVNCHKQWTNCLHNLLESLRQIMSLNHDRFSVDLLLFSNPAPVGVLLHLHHLPLLVGGGMLLWAAEELGSSVESLMFNHWGNVFHCWMPHFIWSVCFLFNRLRINWILITLWIMVIPSIKRVIKRIVVCSSSVW